MNPDRIYQQYRDQALAAQFTAKAYSTFVAMPFAEWFSYRSKEVYGEVFAAAVDRANNSGRAKREFLHPKRVDDSPPVAGDITEEIVVKILDSHFFLADLTFQNAGVLLETGVALGLKPNKRIILVMQGSHQDLHFDIRNVNIMQYSGRNHESMLDKLASAFLECAEAFETECDAYVSSITQRLTPEATICLNQYGRLQKNSPNYSLYCETRPQHLKDIYGEELR